jgi:hypothetical protein
MKHLENRKKRMSLAERMGSKEVASGLVLLLLRQSPKMTESAVISLKI